MRRARLRRLREDRGHFREVEAVARDRGFGAVIDGWEPDVPWLRGDARYREGSGG